MNRIAVFQLLAFVLFATIGCRNSVEEVALTNKVRSSVQTLVEQTVEASCGQCQFGMDGSGCDLAVRIGDQAYWVDGSGIDEHGDAHGKDGLCNCIRKATVSGKIKDGRMDVTSFELIARKKFDEE